MSWIRVIEKNEASGQLKHVYDEMGKKRGKLSNIMKIHSLNPVAMQTHMDLYLSIMFGSSKLSREDRELIAVIVSAANQCEYCINHHAEALHHYLKDRNLIQKIITDFRSVALPEKKIKLLEYAYKLTKTPNKIKKADINDLRKQGFSDDDILNINLITSYFNFVNRIALGLGVEFSESEVKGFKY